MINHLKDFHVLRAMDRLGQFVVINEDQLPFDGPQKV